MDQKRTAAPPRGSFLDRAAHTNRLLDAFEPASRARIDPHIQPVTLALGDVVCEAGGFLEHIYFPRGAVLSLLTVLANGTAIETAHIGNEGAFAPLPARITETPLINSLVNLKVAWWPFPVEFWERN